MSNRISERRTPTGAEREAQKAFRQTDAKVALSEYERAQRALHANRERLKAERAGRAERRHVPDRVRALSLVDREHLPGRTDRPDHLDRVHRRLARLLGATLPSH